MVIRVDQYYFMNVGCGTRAIFRTAEEALEFVYKDMNQMLDEIGESGDVELNRGNRTIKYRGIYHKWFVEVATFDLETKEICFD